MRNQDLAAIFRARAKLHSDFLAQGMGPYTPVDQIRVLLYREYIEMATMLEDESSLPQHKSEYFSNKKEQTK